MEISLENVLLNNINRFLKSLEIYIPSLTCKNNCIPFYSDCISMYISTTHDN